MPVPLGYTGEEETGASALAIAIVAPVTAGPTPWNFHASVDTTGSTGFDNAVTQPEFSWSRTTGRGLTFTNPLYGDTADPSQDQKGHFFADVIDANDTIVCEARAWDGSAYLTDSDSVGVTSDATRGSATFMWFDSVGGDDGNDGLSSGAPKQSASAIKTFLEGGGDRVAMVKYGSSWTGLSTSSGTQWMSPSSGDGGGIIAYGTPGDGKPLFQGDAANTGGYLFQLSSTRPNNFCFQNVEIDGNNAAYAFSAGAGNNSGHEGLLLDRVVLRNGDTGGGTSLGGWNNNDFGRVMLYGCTIDRGTSNDTGIFGQQDGPGAFIACTWEGGGSSPTHDVYQAHCGEFVWYLNDRTEAPAGSTLDRNHLKLAAGAADGDEPVVKACISDSMFRNMGSLLAIAGGDSSNPDPGGDGTHEDTVIQRCGFAVNFGTRLGAHLSNATTGSVIRDCLLWSDSGAITTYLLRIGNFPDTRVYRNRFYENDGDGAALIHLTDIDTTATVVFYENEMSKTGSATAFYATDTNTLSGTTFGPGNIYYAAGSNPWFALHNAGVERPLSAWQTLTGEDGDATYANSAHPTWTDPANGAFDPEELAVLDADGFTEVAHQGTIVYGSIAEGSQQEVLLFNKGRRNNLTVSSIGDTGNITPVSTPTVLKNPHRAYPYTFTADAGTGDTLTVNNDGPIAAFEINLTWDGFSPPTTPSGATGPGRPTGQRTGRTSRIRRC